MGQHDFTLDQRLGVADELKVHAGAVLIDPLAGEFFNRVGDLAEGREAGLAGVGLFVAAQKGDHLVGLTGDGGFHGGFASHEGFVGIGLGGGVGGAALEQAGFRDADLGARNVGADDFGEGVAGTTELGVTEGIRGGVGGHVIAVLIDETLGDDDLAELLALEDALYVFDALGLIEGDLGKVDEVGRILRVILALGESSSGGDPTGTATHDLDDGDEIALTHGLVIGGDFADAGGDVFDGAGVAGAVVGAGQVVIDGLGHADHAELVALGLGELGDFVGGVLGVVATDVEEVADVVGLEDLKDAIKVGLFLEFETAGAESGAGRVFERANLLLRLRSEIDQVLVEDAEHAVERAVDLFDAFMVQRFRDEARDAGVDNRGGAAGLAYQDISYEFSHDSY